jgi:hypothetical protein
MLAQVGLGTGVGHVAPGPTWGHPPGGTPWGAVGWVVRPFWARARALRLYVSFLGRARIWPDSAIFVEFSLSRPWEPPKGASRANLGPRRGARHACVSSRAVGGASSFDRSS